jgi:phenylalanyl-tRNA synthetase alpha chain
MEELVKQINAYKSEMEGYTTADAQGVEAFRIKYLGTKGLVKTSWAN